VIPVGKRVGLASDSANRDPERFRDPDRFDLRRGTTGHLGFGWGPHLCMGAPLARLEACVLWGELAERVERFELAAEPERRSNTIIRGHGCVPVLLVPR